jgi:hypothetical protein
MIEVTILLPDEYQGMIDAIITDTKKQNPDRDDVTAESIIEQVCRQFVVQSYSQIMMNMPSQSTTLESASVA